MDRNLLVIIATFNEMENLPLLVERLRGLINDVTILVVDDSSPDGTGVWASEQAEKSSDLFALVRKGERGLGSATLAGFRWGMAHEFEYLATMDADFSHNPDSLKELFEAIKTNEQWGLVIGSRYVQGGKIEGWPIRRRVVSRFVNWFSRLWLGLKTRDNTGAFRVYRASALAQIELDRIRATGYGYLEEILFNLRQQEIQMAELPIVFKDRQVGNSKTSMCEGVRVLTQILLMRMR